MRHQLHMMDSVRSYFIERHDFYVEQVKCRVLSHFYDINGEADRFADAEYERLCQLPGDGNVELADLADTARERALNFYMLLDDLREQSLLGALAGSFHQWDKELREFLDRELMHTMPEEERAKFAWNPNWTVILNGIKAFGWDIRAATCFPFLDAGRLIVNVYKHGNGRSLTELAEHYPQYIYDPLTKPHQSFCSDFLDHSWVHISEQEFDKLATNGIRQFWLDFPELMFSPT